MDDGDVVIRDATLDDLPDLRAVFRRASMSNEDDRPLFVEHPEFLELSDAAIREGRMRVAVVDGEVVGFATTLVGPDAVELEDLFVDPDRMRHGIGRALIDDVRATTTAAGRSRVEVDGNRHALLFYSAVGFIEDGTVRLKHGVAIRMHLDVDP
ncbi:MAG: GNAT family N-acetyltransferase [Chloroflexi bacterium]|nr:GNAT family N-acetyltransferase [Chloroflexota bacterium]